MIGLSCLRNALALLAGLGMLGQSSLAADRLEDFASRVELKVAGEGPWYRLELPMALHFTAAHADLRDLRVFNAEGEALAYALTRSSAYERRSRQEHRLRAFPLRGLADDGMTVPSVRIERSTTGTLVQVVPDAAVPKGDLLRGWLLDTSGIQLPLEKLSLDWNGGAEGFQRFSIEASDDLQHWTSWGEGQVARLSYADERIDQQEVTLPGRPARYLRLLWVSPTQAPELSEVRVTSASREHLPAAMAWSAALEPLSAKDNEYLWELPLGLSIERLRIPIDRPGSLLPVRLQARRDGSPNWQPLASGLLYRLPEGGREVVRDELELPGWMPVKQLRLSVDPRAGGFGQQIPRLEVGMQATHVVFLARGTPPFILALGNPSAARVELPLATLVPGFEERRLATMARAELVGEPALGDHAVPGGEPAGGLVWKRIGLWAVLLLGVGLLAAMAYSLLRRPTSKA
ncbi:DUF3999 domain-containing protein [Metapseudomonas boanensis]|uniref:DUF3999 domain-containing protein n=1 Tax=Metapseudomonas boanensis TaxID=2822138 RepID=A0ABS5XDF7_9GAMM|nr:DUF3999 domain-containing protein [Pseudomonas boanensis]MBT8765721.1 DUF3999 domain-containing protein [Pseudomonas boanensis]